MRDMEYIEDVGFVPVDEPTPLQTETITWHPYPLEKPTELDEYGQVIMYLVTVKTAHVDVDAFIDGRWFGYSDDEVIAWAERPKPYEG